MGRISMPQLPPLNPSFREKSKTIFERSKAIQTLTSFLLNSSNCIVITGAGLSVDSGIRAYRGKDGSYSINKTYRPIFFQFSRLLFYITGIFSVNFNNLKVFENDIGQDHI